MAERAGLVGLDSCERQTSLAFRYSLANLAHVQKVLNIVICISVLSIGLSCVYGGSRVLTALAETGYAPKCFTYVDKSGRPLYSVMVVLAFGPIA